MTPTPEEFRYMLWAAMAVQGLMREADTLQRQLGGLIEAQAAKFRKQFKFQRKPVYRGIVVNMDKVKDGKLIENYPVEFLSFTESLEVACWFAMTDSFMNQQMMAQRPDAKGWVMKHTPLKEDVIWHWGWLHKLPFKKVMDHIDLNLRSNGIHTDLGQFVHNANTQREVILKAKNYNFLVEPVEKYCGKMDVKTLDKKYKPPGF